MSVFSWQAQLIINYLQRRPEKTSKWSNNPPANPRPPISRRQQLPTTHRLAEGPDFANSSRFHFALFQGFQRHILVAHSWDATLLCQAKRTFSGWQAGETLVNVRQTQKRLGQLFNLIFAQGSHHLLFHNVIVKLLLTDAVRGTGRTPLRINPCCGEHQNGVIKWVWAPGASNRTLSRTPSIRPTN